MTRVLAIDPGNTESAYVLIDAATRRPLDFGKIPNQNLLDELAALACDPDGDGNHLTERVAIEMIASYGMSVGAEVFETCVWIGRYRQRLHDYGWFGLPIDLVKRQPIKLHHCHSARAKDSNITQALVDRFAPGQPNRGKGTKADPGWFYGFAADVWQAYALAVYIADTTRASTPDVVLAGSSLPGPPASTTPRLEEAPF